MKACAATFIAASRPQSYHNKWKWPRRESQMNHAPQQNVLGSAATKPTVHFASGLVMPLLRLTTLIIKAYVTKPHKCHTKCGLQRSPFEKSGLKHFYVRRREWNSEI